MNRGTRILDLAALACLLLLLASLVEPRAKDAAPPATPLAAARPVAQFPPAFEEQIEGPLPAAARTAPSLRGDGDAAIERLAQWVTLDLDPLRRGFANSSDLYAFVLRHLPRAKSGDGASNYYVYLALDECRPYLRLGADEVRTLIERMQHGFAEALPEERQSWSRDAQRCYRFAGGDLGPIVEALGEDRPGSESEYGSVLFERAANAGFAPALAERGLREPGFSVVDRDAMLRAALRSDNADVYWQVFRHSWNPDDEAQAALSLAWLIEACRKGYDCSARAPWFQVGECADGSQRCLPSQSALSHYWFAASAAARDEAFRLARAIDDSVTKARWDDVPLPIPRDAEQAALALRSGAVHANEESSMPDDPSVLQVLAQ
jgi:hypothetical protein